MRVEKLVGTVVAAAACFAAGAASASADTVSFTTPGEHAYTVPAGVTRVDVLAVGGEGAGSSSWRGGLAARIAATLDVTPGQTLYAEVGSSGSGTTPGANGGGAAGGTAAECAGTPGAGGGATDVRTVAVGNAGSAASRVLVAGGGGGAGSLAAADTSSDDAMATHGGHRGQGGWSAELSGWGGQDGTGGSGAAGAGSAGTTTTGGRGGVGIAGDGSGCGGGGGGGYGGGGAGAAGAAGHDGGGGGGGGSLVPGGFPPGVAGRGDAPVVTFTTPGEPAQTGPLQISSTQSLRHVDLGGGIVDFTDCVSSCSWWDAGASGPAPGTEGYDFPYASTEGWGFAPPLLGDFRQSLASVAPPPAGSATDVGEPFLLSSFAHYNEPTVGDSPTALGLQTTLTLQPPAGQPAVFSLLGHDAIELNYIETPNKNPCDPTIQESSVPCDDDWQIGSDTATATADGVDWHLQVLGWRTPDGGFAHSFSTEEDEVTQGRIYAQVTVDTNATTSTLAVDGSTPASPVLQLTTTPVPQTGGTVTFTDGGTPIAGCANVPVDASDGVTTCTPTGLAAGAHTFAGRFEGGVGYAASDAAPVSYTVPGTSGGGGTPPAWYQRLIDLIVHLLGRLG